MTTTLGERSPFDDEDAAAASRYLRSRELTAFDPFAAGDAGEDMLFATSLSYARWAMEQSFGTATQDGRRFRGYPVFVERSSPNAFAIDVEGVHVCGVHVGLVASLLEISMFAFSQATLFPEIGDAAGERSPTLPPGSMLSFWIADQLRADPATANKPIGKEIMPRHAERHLAAHFLAQLMLRFAWLHELFHALNGHCGLMAVRRRGTALNEVPDDTSAAIVEAVPADSDPQWRLTLHCMEFDADRTALWVMMRLQESEVEPMDSLAALPKAVRIKLVLFAGFLMTFLFDQAAQRGTRDAEMSHPLAYHRLHNLVRTIASNLFDPEGTTKAAFAEVINEMTRLRERVPGLCSAAQLLADLRDANLQATFDRIEEILEAARLQFNQFAFSLCEEGSRPAVF